MPCVVASFQILSSASLSWKRAWMSTIAWMGNIGRYNAAPSQELLVICRTWLVSRSDLSSPIGSQTRGVAVGPSMPRPRAFPSWIFAEAYAQRRCIVPIDGFEWRAIKGARATVRCTKDGSPLWHCGRTGAIRTQGEWQRTFVITTVPSNSSVGRSTVECQPFCSPGYRVLARLRTGSGLISSLPSEPMTMWPIPLG